MRIRLIPLAMTGFILVGVACSGSSTSTTDGPVSTQTLDSFAATICDKIKECTGDFVIKKSYGSIETCKSRQASQLQLDAKSPGYGVTEGAGQGCKTAILALPCNQVLTGVLPKECDFRGTQADGANCVADAQCLSGSCFVPDNGSCGKCALDAAEGADCSTAKCVDGLVCNNTKRCVKRGAEGVACSADTPCEFPLSCVKGTCTKALASGAACTLGGDETPCDVTKGLVCIPTKLPSLAGACAPVSFAAVGEDCNLTGRDPPKISICSNGECVNDKCVAYLPEGAACTVTGSPPCQEPAECRNGKCSLLDSATCK